MIKPMLVIAIFLISSVVATLLWFIDRQGQRQATLLFHFVNQWKKARADRHMWLQNHSYIENPFEDEMYEKLWECELGAEELLHIHFPHGQMISLNEYEVEKKQADT